MKEATDQSDTKKISMRLDEYILVIINNTNGRNTKYQDERSLFIYIALSLSPFAKLEMKRFIFHSLTVLYYIDDLEYFGM